MFPTLFSPASSNVFEEWRANSNHNEALCFLGHTWQHRGRRITDHCGQVAYVNTSSAMIADCRRRAAITSATYENQAYTFWPSLKYLAMSCNPWNFKKNRNKMLLFSFQLLLTNYDPSVMQINTDAATYLTGLSWAVFNAVCNLLLPHMVQPRRNLPVKNQLLMVLVRLRLLNSWLCKLACLRAL